MVGDAMTLHDISLREVTLQFGGRRGSDPTVIFRNLNLDIERGSFTVLLGPSGCGKSSILNIVDGLRSVVASRIEVLGHDIRNSPDITRQVAYVFQDSRMLRWKTLRKNVEFALRGLAIQPRDRWDELIEHYFDAVGLSKYLDYYPHEVSGGMQQRVAIVRGWVNEPQILLMDEPFSHLDEITAAELRDQLIKLWQRDEERRTILFVTHDINEAVKLATRIVMLTPQPSQICHDERVLLPYPRRGDLDEVLQTEGRLRRIFAERAGVRM